MVTEYYISLSDNVIYDLLFVISRVISSSTIDLYNKYMNIKVHEVGLCKTALERILKICELQGIRMMSEIL